MLRSHAELHTIIVVLAENNQPTSVQFHHIKIPERIMQKRNSKNFLALNHTQQDHSLLSHLSGIYFPNEEQSIDQTLFLPIMSEAKNCKCISAYFTSGAVAELARALSVFLKSPNAKITFIISPVLNEADYFALERGLNTEENLVPLVFPSFHADEVTLRSKAIDALSYLVATKKLEFKIATMQSNDGMMHAKVWLFETDHELISITGSSNATKPGLRNNFEQIRTDVEPINSDARIFDALNTRFEKIWADRYEGIKTHPANERTMKALESLVRKKNLSPEKISKELDDALMQPDDLMSAPQRMRIPQWLNYNQGDFSHQGLAITAWQAESYRGMLSIATGGGKTLTALTAATLLQDNSNALLVLILVPTTPLAGQWKEEVRLFGIEAVSSLDYSGDDLLTQVRSALRRLSNSASKTEIVILTRDTYLLDSVYSLFQKNRKSIDFMLICDEVHNFGSAGFRNNPSDEFKYRLGLSATVERQFDDEGTNFLKNYFGPVVFEFTLKEAIGKCLVPFDYHAGTVYLTAEEEEKWLELSEQIAKLAYAHELPDTDPNAIRLKTLRLARRRIIESARNKIQKFASDLPNSADEVRRALVFCSDKSPEQLNAVNSVLSDRGIYFHQITSDETRNKYELKKITDSYSSGELQVLTSKKVIDEGFNAPQTETAYLLAAHTGRRQWIQRLGRVLRKSSGTQKKFARVYDYIAIPQTINGPMDVDFKSLIRGEFDRVSFFSELSRNGSEENGSIKILARLLELLETK